MKKMFLILTLLLSMLSCEKKDKLVVTCSGDCDNPEFIVEGESATNVTFNYSSNYTYDGFGNISKITFSGSVTYNTSGNTYQISGIINKSPCSYSITVTNGGGDKATCSH
jgi:hypothetical protein